MLGVALGFDARSVPGPFEIVSLVSQIRLACTPACPKRPTPSLDKLLLQGPSAGMPERKGIRSLRCMKNCGSPNFAA